MCLRNNIENYFDAPGRTRSFFLVCVGGAPVIQLALLAGQTECESCYNQCCWLPVLITNVEWIRGGPGGWWANGAHPPKNWQAPVASSRACRLARVMLRVFDQSLLVLSGPPEAQHDESWARKPSQNGAKSNPNWYLRSILAKDSRSAFGTIIYHTLLPSGHPAPFSTL